MQQDLRSNSGTAPSDHEELTQRGDGVGSNHSLVINAEVGVLCCHSVSLCILSTCNEY